MSWRGWCWAHAAWWSSTKPTLCVKLPKLARPNWKLPRMTWTPKVCHIVAFIGAIVRGLGAVVYIRLKCRQWSRGILNPPCAPSILSCIPIVKLRSFLTLWLSICNTSLPPKTLSLLWMSCAVSHLSTQVVRIPILSYHVDQQGVDGIHQFWKRPNNVKFAMAAGANPWEQPVLYTVHDFPGYLKAGLYTSVVGPSWQYTYPWGSQ